MEKETSLSNHHKGGRQRVASRGLVKNRVMWRFDEQDEYNLRIFTPKNQLQREKW